MTRGPFKKRCCRGENSEGGQALILAIVFLVIFSLLLTALLSGVGVNLSQTAVANDQGQLQYAADAGIEWGINQLEQSGSQCNSPGTQISGTPFYPVLGNPGKTDGSTPFQITNPTAHGPIATTVYCEPMTGLGSGIFGGYTVVTGMNYPNTPGYPGFTSPYGSQEFAGSQNCTSFSGDPVGSAASATYATPVASTSTNLSPLCLSYPSNPWTDTGFMPDENGVPVTPGNISETYANDAGDIFAVGAPATPTQTGTVSINNTSLMITSPTLFLPGTDYVGFTITDAGGDFNANTKVVTENITNNTITLSARPKNTKANAQITLTGTQGGGIFHFDGQDDFSYVGASAPNTTLTGVWAPQSDPNHVWVVGNSGTILSCSSSCSNESAVWTAQTSGTARNLTAITGINGSSPQALWAVGASGTLVSYNGTAWAVDSLQSQSPVSGSATVTHSGPWVVNSPIFTAAQTHLGWKIADNASPSAFGANSIITAESSGTATVNPNPGHTENSGTYMITLTPPSAPTPAFTSVYADASGNIWAAGSSNNLGVIYECANPCSTSTPTWTPVPVTTPPTTYASITGTGTSLWAVGGSSISVCASSCGTAPWSTYQPPNAGTLTDIVAADAGDIWLVTSNVMKAGNTPAEPIMYCHISCNTSGASWSTEAINDPESTLNTLTAVPASLQTDPTWAGSVWVAGNIPGAGNGTGWATYTPTPAGNNNNFLLDMKGGNVLNGGALNLATPVEIDGGQFVQYAASTCPPPPGRTALKFVNGGASPYQCTTANSSAAFSSNSLLSPLLSVDEPLPSESASGLAACVQANNCTDLSSSAITVHTPSASCPSFTEYFPGYYTNLKADPSGGGTTYFASGVYYLHGTGGPLDNGYVIGGQPGPGDAPTVVTNSPCWQYISDNWQNLDNGSSTGMGLPAGTTCTTTGGGGGTSIPCAFPSGTWYEGIDSGGSATTSPNGTGVSWVLGNKASFDVHTVDLELFTRQVPDYLSSGTGLGPNGSKTVSQENNEGTSGVTIREVPPVCGASPPGTLGIDGAMHPGPFCVLASSGWAPLNPGVNDQTIQVDANNKNNDRNPFVYIHGAIYMPDNNMTLFTNSPGKDVWVGALDVNSLELTFNSQSSPPIQIIGGGSPQVAKVELISQAQDPISNTTVWEEAVVNEPLFGAKQTGTQANKAAAITNGSRTIGSFLFGPTPSYIGFTVTGNGIPPNTTIVSEDTQHGLAQMSNAATLTNSSASITLSPIPSIQSWRYCNGGGSPSPTAFIQACRK